MYQYYLILGLLMPLWFAPISPTTALTCRQTNHQNICIFKIERSAKYYWEYRAQLSIDGIPQPIAKYNCRDRTQILSDGNAIALKPENPGTIICTLFKTS